MIFICTYVNKEQCYGCSLFVDIVSFAYPACIPISFPQISSFVQELLFINWPWVVKRAYLTSNQSINLIGHFPGQLLVHKRACDPISTNNISEEKITGAEGMFGKFLLLLRNVQQAMESLFFYGHYHIRNCEAMLQPVWRRKHVWTIERNHIF